MRRYGIYKRRLLEGQSEDTYEWQVGHPLISPNILALPSERHMLLGYRVPVDDSHTLNLSYYAMRPRPSEEIDANMSVTYDPLTYDDLGRIEGLDTGREDEMVWVAQGPITDRTQWHPAMSDKGVNLFHQTLLENVEQVERGEDPLGTIRDREENEPLIQIDPGPKPGGWRATFMGVAFESEAEQPAALS